MGNLVDANNREIVLDLHQHMDDDHIAEMVRRINMHNELVDELEEARDDIAGWGVYASEYFQEKWDLKGHIARVNLTIRKAMGES